MNNGVEEDENMEAANTESEASDHEDDERASLTKRREIIAAMKSIHLLTQGNNEHFVPYNSAYQYTRPFDRMRLNKNEIKKLPASVREYLGLPASDLESIRFKGNLHITSTAHCLATTIIHASNF